MRPQRYPAHGATRRDRPEGVKIEDGGVAIKYRNGSLAIAQKQNLVFFNVTPTHLLNPGGSETINTWFWENVVQAQASISIHIEAAGNKTITSKAARQRGSEAAK